MADMRISKRAKASSMEGGMSRKEIHCGIRPAVRVPCICSQMKWELGEAGGWATNGRST